MKNWSSDFDRVKLRERFKRRRKNAAALRIIYIGEESDKHRTESEQTEIWEVKKTLAFCDEDYEENKGSSP